jgi:serine/threonine-protein kinase
MARAAVRRSLELDDSLSEAHATLGALESLDSNLQAAEKAFRRAITLDPNDPTAHHWYAMHCLVDLGRFDDALVELRAAQALDPLALIVLADVAAVLYLMREPGRALEQCRRVLALDPSFARAHVYGGLVHAERGNFGEAVSAFETASRFDGSPWTTGWLGYGCGKAGRRAEAERVLADLRRMSQSGIEVAFQEALVQTGLGEREQALESLERALTERSLGFSVARYFPVFDDMRDDRRFQRLVARIDRRRTAGARVGGVERT